jgi:hypothetical protein
MSLHSEWTNVDIIHPSLPSMVASSDLFDGELFGDELIDIYDSTVDTHHPNDGMEHTSFVVVFALLNYALVESDF